METHEKHKNDLFHHDETAVSLPDQWVVQEPSERRGMKLCSDVGAVLGTNLVFSLAFCREVESCEQWSCMLLRKSWRKFVDGR